MPKVREPRGIVWTDSQLADLREAELTLFNAVIYMMCADTMHQTAQERQSVVAYIKAMAIEINRETGRDAAA